MSDELRAVAARLRAGIDANLKRIFLTSAARALLDAVRARTNVGKTGRLRANTRIAYVNDEEARIINDSPVAKFVHDGTKPHVILPKFISRNLARSEGGGSDVLMFQKDGRWWVARKVRHPGYKGNPFFKLGASDAQAELDSLAAQLGRGVIEGFMR